MKYGEMWELPKVYVDESGWNLYIRRRKGRSKRGQPAVVEIPNAKGKNVTLIAAISESVGMVEYEVRLGGTNRTIFADFLRRLVAKLRGSHCIVMDNAAIHKYNDVKEQKKAEKSRSRVRRKNVKDRVDAKEAAAAEEKEVKAAQEKDRKENVNRIATDAGHSILYLPPYSPF